MNAKEIAILIDHTYLKAEGTTKHIDKLIEEAKKHNFKTICINPSWIKYAKTKLKNTNVGITTVVGFPLGANSMQSKVFESKLAIDHGVDEVDMVINIGRLKDKQDDYVLEEIKKVKTICKDHILKVIIEIALLTNEEKERVIKIVGQSGADFIKTSTGFSYHGATIEDVKLMRELSPKKVKVKAAGGVKTLEDLKNMVNAGAERIGTSNGVKIITKLS